MTAETDAKFKTESNTKDYCLFSFEAFYIRLNFMCSTLKLGHFHYHKNQWM
jgi:hypothetical protein